MYSSKITEQMIEWLDKQTDFEQSKSFWPKEELWKYRDIKAFIASTNKERWQPIEEMPAYDPQNPELRFLVTGGGLGTQVDVRLADGDWIRHALKEGYVKLPTHFMPVPAAPVKGE